nr:hypothetical protein Iba_scaffold19491CG0150 [Ipomoea batatas]
MKSPPDSVRMPASFQQLPMICINSSDGRDLKCWPFIHLDFVESKMAPALFTRSIVNFSTANHMEKNSFSVPSPHPNSAR